jgi:hypothetical protein
MEGLTIKDLLQGVLDGKYNLDDNISIFVYKTDRKVYEYKDIESITKQIPGQIEICIKEAK